MSDELTADEVGCQINLATGEHIGECKGTCRSEALETIDDLHVEAHAGISARIEALEAQVRWLRTTVVGMIAKDPSLMAVKGNEEYDDTTKTGLTVIRRH